MIKFRKWENILLLAKICLAICIATAVIMTAYIDQNAGMQIEYIYPFIPVIVLGIISASMIPLSNKIQKRALCEEFAWCASKKINEYGGTIRRIETHVRFPKEAPEYIEIDIFIYGSVPNVTEIECRRSFNRRARDIFLMKKKHVLFNFQVFGIERL